MIDRATDPANRKTCTDESDELISANFIKSIFHLKKPAMNCAKALIAEPPTMASANPTMI